MNLSSHKLSDAELSLLSKGLTFVDTPPEPDLGILTEDLAKFHLGVKRHLAQGKLFPTNVPNTNSASKDIPFEHQKFKNPSKWNPPAPAIFEHMALKNENNLLNFTPQTANPKRKNLTQAETQAKQNLSKNKDIVIKKAD